MASDKKKILMFDESTGMLSREVMLAYIYGELSPSLRQDMDAYLSNNEMHRDIIEGLRQLENPNQIEKAIHAINERVGERSGAEASPGGATFEMPDVFREYGKIAAILVGALLLSGIVFTVMMMREPSDELALSEKAEKEEMAQTGADMKSPPPATPSRQIQTITEDAADSALITGEVNQDTTADSLALEGEQPPMDQTIALADNSKPEEEKSDRKKKERAKKESDADGSGNAVAADSTQPTNENLALNSRQANSKVSGDADDEVKNMNDMNFAAQDAVAEQARAMEKPDADKTAGEVQPEYPGGQAALQQYLRNNLKYPPDSKEQSIEGKVYVNFLVGSSGRVKEIKVAKGINKEINAEAIRLVANMPVWKPGTLKGKPATMPQLLIIDFKIE